MAAKKLRRIFWIAAAFLALVVALLLVLLLVGVRVDLSGHRGSLETAAAEALGRQVIIVEPLALEVSLSPSLQIGGLQVGGPSGWKGDHFAILGPAEVRISLSALLRKRILVTRLAVQQIRISLEKDRNGDPNWILNSSGEEDGFGFAGVEALVLTGVEIGYRGGPEEQPMALGFEEISGCIIAGAPVTVTARASLGDEALTATLSLPTLGEIQEKGSPWPLDVQGECAGITGGITVHQALFEEEISLDADLHLGGEELRELGRLAGKELPPAGPFALTGTLSSKGTALNLKGLSIEAVGNSLAGDLGLELAGERILVSGDLVIGPLDLEPLLLLGGQEDAPDEPLEKPVLPDRLGIKLGLAIGTVLNAPVRATGLQLNLNVDRGELRLPFRGTVEDHAVDGELRAGGERNRPHLRLALATGLFDLSPLLNEATGNEARPTTKEPQENVVTTVAGWMHRLDADFSLHADTLGGVPLDVEKIVLEGCLRDGALNLPARAELAGTPFQGTLNITARGGGLEAGLDAVAENLDLEALAGQVTGQDDLHGSVGRLDLTLATQGNGPESLINSLKADLSLENAELLHQGITDQGVRFFAGQGRAQLTEFGGSELLRMEVSIDDGRLGILSPQSSPPATPDLPCALEGGLSRTGEVWNMSLQSAHLGNSRVAGEATLSPGTERPMLLASLRSEVIDHAELKGLFPPASVDDADGATPPNRTAVTLDLQLDLEVGRIPTTVGDVTEVRAALVIDDGLVKEAPASAVIDGTRYEGRFGMEEEDGRMRAGFSLGAENVDVGSLMSLAGVTREVDATAGAVHLDIWMAGGNIEEMLEGHRFDFTVEEGRFSVPDLFTERLRHISIPKALLRRVEKGQYELELEPSIDGYPALVVDGRIEVTAALNGTGKKALTHLKLVGPRSETEIESAIALPFTPVGTELGITLSGERLDIFDRLLNVSLPPLGPIHLAGRLWIEEDGFRLTDAAVGAGESILRGTAQLAMTGERPRLEGDFRVETLQLRDFDLKGWSPLRGATGKNAESEETVPLLSPGRLRSYDGRLSLEVAEARLGDERLGMARLDGTLESGKLDISLGMEIPGGEVAADCIFTAEDDGALTELWVSIDNFDYGDLLRQLKEDAVASGTFSLRADLTARGKDFAHPIRNSSGRFDFTLWPENANAKIFDYWATNIFFAILPNLDPESKPSVNCLTGFFDMNDGVLTPRTLLIDTTTVRVRGKGTVDLKKKRVDLVLRPKAKRPQFFTLSTPLTVTGPLSSFRIGTTPLGVVETSLRYAASIVTVPVAWITSRVQPKGGEDVCLEPPEVR